MSKELDKLFKGLLTEQEEQSAEKENPMFNPAEQKFLGKFAELQTNHIGIIYSKSDVGIQEFLTRAGSMYNLTAPVLYSLLKNQVISIEPYGGYGRNDDYTLKLNIDIENVKDFIDPESEMGSGDVNPEASDEGEPVDDAETGDAAETGGNEVDIDSLQGESIVTEQQYNRLPAGFHQYLDRILDIITQKYPSNLDKYNAVAKMLRILANRFKFTPLQIMKAYAFYKSRKD